MLYLHKLKLQEDTDPKLTAFLEGVDVSGMVVNPAMHPSPGSSMRRIGRPGPGPGCSVQSSAGQR